MDRRLIWKFNIIDLLIIAVVLLSIFALVYRAVAGNDNQEAPYTISYICDNAPYSLLGGIEAGDLCADGETGASLGEVISVTPEATTADGLKGKAEISVTVDAYKEEHGIVIEDTLYLKGKEMQLIVDDAIFNVYISDIE